jgi:hypothetical protein
MVGGRLVILTGEYVVFMMEVFESLFLLFNSQTNPTPFAVLEPNFTYDGLSHSSAKIAHFSMALQMR